MPERKPGSTGAWTNAVPDSVWVALLLPVMFCCVWPLAVWGVAAMGLEFAWIGVLAWLICKIRKVTRRWPSSR